MTYNIRKLGEEKIDANQWKFRSKFLIDIIRRSRPDILCIQEDCLSQIEEIRENLKNSDSFGFYNEEINSGISGEANTIFFNVKKFQLLGKGYFWLSDTPDRKSKVKNQSLHYRTVTYVLLKDKYNKKISIFNTHFDHISNEVQEKEAKFLVKLINRARPENYVICGDFNGDINSRQIKILEEKFNLINRDTSDQITVIDWSEAHPPRKCLDFIFSNFLKKMAKADDSTYLARDGKRRTPSDHLPVLCELEM